MNYKLNCLLGHINNLKIILYVNNRGETNIFLDLGLPLKVRTKIALRLTKDIQELSAKLADHRWGSLGERDDNFHRQLAILVRHVSLSDNLEATSKTKS